MHVCLVSIELFGDGIYGGFGRATRFIGRELVKRNVRVTIVVPRRTPDQPDCYELEGMTVRQYRPSAPWTALKCFRDCGADIYHSQDASMGTWLARRAMPGRRHVVTLRDPLSATDWSVETELSGQSRLSWGKYRLFIDNPLVAGAVRRAHGLYCAAEFLIPKVVHKYNLHFQPEFLPTPIDIPASVRKADEPTVSFVGRWDGRKRPELFFRLASEFPGVRFIAVGGARDGARDQRLREEFGRLPNLQMTGVLDQFRTGRLSDVLSQSWILVNTSAREGLPTTFLEAAAHRCAILSFHDPDGFASRFGLVAEEGRLREALASLLAADRWQKLGEAGYDHVKTTSATNVAMDAHRAAYDAVLARKA